MSRGKATAGTRSGAGEGRERGGREGGEKRREDGEREGDSGDERGARGGEKGQRGRGPNKWLWGGSNEGAPFV